MHARCRGRRQSTERLDAINERMDSLIVDLERIAAAIDRLLPPRPGKPARPPVEKRHLERVDKRAA
jgi:hypothetical protein